MILPGIALVKKRPSAWILLIPTLKTPWLQVRSSIAAQIVAQSVICLLSSVISNTAFKQVSNAFILVSMLFFTASMRALSC